jgi:cytidine deaminase
LVVPSQTEHINGGGKEMVSAGNPKKERASASGGKAPSPRELVFAICKPSGVDDQSVIAALGDALSTYAYRLHTIDISDQLDALGPRRRDSRKSKNAHLMDIGDALRSKYGKDIIAHMAVAEISRLRGLAEVPSRNAFVITSLKRVDEVKSLRKVYGTHLILLGVTSPAVDREQFLAGRLRDEFPSARADEIAKMASGIVTRDAQDDLDASGQQMRKTFSHSDAIVDFRTVPEMSKNVARIVDLLFGRSFITPTVDEQGINFASAARLRSADPGRQVGAAVVDMNGELIVTGCNDVPRPGGGQYWAGDDPDLRDFSLGWDSNNKLKMSLLIDLISRLGAKGILSAKSSRQSPKDLAAEALSDGGALADAQFKDLLEFGRVAHAEMAAIATAARRGVPLAGSTMFTTTYPCHLCARMILAAGIARVVYVHPYPKSRVREMYAHEISDSERHANGMEIVPFVPFSGIGPRLFSRVFDSESQFREHNDDGRMMDWSADRAALTGVCMDCTCSIELERDSVEKVVGQMTLVGASVA